jgi:hypothetical protein
MTTLATAFRRYLLLATMPAAALAFSGCGDDDDNDSGNGRVMAVHAAAAANVPVKIVADNAEISQLEYGRNSAYTNVSAGSRTLKINDATTNSLAGTIERDKNYSLFAYSPAATIGSAALLLVPDDLTAPAANKAKIRVVHLGLSAASPVNLSLTGPVGRVDIVTNVAFGTASPFIEIEPNSYNLAVSAGSGATATTEVSVGDGSGSGTGNKAYAAGKIYTVVVRGIKSTSVASAQQLKATIIENN